MVHTHMSMIYATYLHISNNICVYTGRHLTYYQSISILMMAPADDISLMVASPLILM